MVPEEQLLARFFLPTKRARYAEMIGHPKKRRKFLLELAHFKSLDPRYILPMPPQETVSRTDRRDSYSERRTTNLLDNLRAP